MEAMKATKGVGRRSGEERNKSVSKLVKARLQFPVSCIARFLKKGRYAQRTGTSLQFPVGRIAHFLVTHIARFLQFPFYF